MTGTGQLPNGSLKVLWQSTMSGSLSPRTGPSSINQTCTGPEESQHVSRDLPVLCGRSSGVDSLIAENYRTVDTNPVFLLHGLMNSPPRGSGLSPDATSGLTVRFACCCCGQHLEVNSEAAGQNLDCVGCGASVIIPELSTIPPELPDQAPTTKRCPFCAETVHRDAIKCKHCGEFLHSSLRQVGPSLPPSQPVAPGGTGCPKCGSRDIIQKKYTSGAGWGLFIGGLLASLFTFGISLILCAIALFLTEYRARCRACRWTWKT